MTKSIAVTPYFERAEGKDDDVAETYVAGLRGARGANVGVEVVLPARLVERTVLVGARLSISLAPDGRIVLDAEGLDSETIEAASKAGGLAKQTIGSVIADCLRLDLLEGEDDPLGDLRTFRAQLVHGLAQLDQATEGMKKRTRRS